MVDNRRNRRYVCAGLAEVYIQPCQTTFSAKVTDLSRSGCLLTFSAASELALEQILEVAFTVDQEPFRLRGKVKSTPPSHRKSEHAAGIEFVAPSSRTQERLFDLLEYIADKQWRLGIS